MATASADTAAASWEQQIAATNAYASELNVVHSRLLNLVQSVRTSGFNPSIGAGIEQLLNKTIPQTEEGRRLAFILCFLSRGSAETRALSDFLTRTHQAALLLLVDGASAAQALGATGLLEIRIGDDGLFHVTAKTAAVPPRVPAPARPQLLQRRPQPVASVAPTAPVTPPEADTSGEWNDVQRKKARKRTRPPKPTMGLDKCIAVVAEIETVAAAPPGSWAHRVASGRQEPAVLVATAVPAVHASTAVQVATVVQAAAAAAAQTAALLVATKPVPAPAPQMLVVASASSPGAGTDLAVKIAAPATPKKQIIDIGPPDELTRFNWADEPE